MIPQISFNFQTASGVFGNQSPFQGLALRPAQGSFPLPALATVPLNTQSGLRGAFNDMTQMLSFLTGVPTQPLAMQGFTQSIQVPFSVMSSPGFSQSLGVPSSGLNNPAVNVTSGDFQQKLRLDNTLAAISQDPEGSRLLAAAIEKGYTLEVGDPSAVLGGSFDANSVTCTQCMTALDGGRQINGVAVPSQKRIVINPNAPDFEKTVVHELVHAASDGDGNSQQEEGIADVVGFRVASRITGEVQPGSAQSIYLNKMTNYPDLNFSNSIRNTLASLGIIAGV
jgi:hypothetical protein